MKRLICLLLLAACSSLLARDISLDWPGVHVRDYALSGDQLELYVTMENVAKDSSVIVRMSRIGDQWSAPEVASFSGQFKDLEPFLHPNGKQLFFASNRDQQQQTAGQQFDLWYVERDDHKAPWGSPVRLPEVINTTTGNEFYPSVTREGHLYFTATRSGGAGQEDIWVSRLEHGVYQPAQALPEAINSATYEFNAFISADEQFLLFSSYGRPDDHGGGDLYVSVKRNGQWQPASNLGPEINSNKLDYCPFYDEQNGVLYWASGHSRKAVMPGRMNFTAWLDWIGSGANGWHKVYQADWSPEKDQEGTEDAG
jgi:hypothetical protein